MKDTIDPKDKAAMEKEFGHSLTDFMLRVLMHIDGDYSQDELKEMCRKKGLVISGNKRPLALRVLLKEIESMRQNIK